ncbi:all-trans-retinol 13,14-reductase-like [Amphiura filiformis]|uniref:all-trans-retinol 13,14-reductase-like n=1 Tax=Amphiura filiformis TaxID=82378 RepID=UPI003B21F946
MAFASKLVTFVGANFPTIAVIALIVLLVIIFVKLLGGTKSGPNPFAHNSIRTPEPLVTELAKRDKVLKQGFKANSVPDGLDAIVIGSGIGGLSVASILSRVGKKVLVLEQHDQAGGCCHTYIDKGFEFDVGIHLIGEMAGNTLTKLYMDQLTDGQLTWVPLDDNFDNVAIGKAGEHKHYPLMAGSRQIFRDALVKQFPDEEKAIDQYMKLIKDAAKTLNNAVVIKLLPVSVVKFLISTGLINLVTKWFNYSSRTLQEVVDGLTDNAHLKAVLCYSFGDYGTMPDETSFCMHALLINHYVHGAYYPRGGASEIAFHIIPTIERSGGRVLVRAPVKEILLDSEGKACGVRVKKTSGDVDIHAPLIISNAGIANTFGNLLPKQITSKFGEWQSKYKGARHGVGSMNLFVGLRGTKEELNLPANQLWAYTGPDYNKAVREYMAKSREDCFNEDIPLLFISFPSAKDPTYNERFPGKSACTVVTLGNWDWFAEWEDERVMKRGDDYESFKDIMAKKAWEQVCGYFPQVKDRVEYFEAATPVTNKFYIGAMKGEMYGLDHNKERFQAKLWSRMRPETNIPNLYLTGQDIMTCGMTGAMFGGLICACKLLNRNVMGDLANLRKKMKKSK